jgi:hypothetical protein
MKNFEERLGSVREGRAILRGRKKPWRRIEPPRFRRAGDSRANEAFRVGACNFDRCQCEDVSNRERGRRRPTGPAAAPLSIIEHDQALAAKAIHRGRGRGSDPQVTLPRGAGAKRPGGPPSADWSCPNGLGDQRSARVGGQEVEFPSCGTRRTRNGAASRLLFSLPKCIYSTWTSPATSRTQPTSFCLGWRSRFRTGDVLSLSKP